MKVAIAGYGAEGASSYRYFSAKGDDVTIVTTRVSERFPIPDGAKSIVAEDAFEHLAEFDVVVRTPPMRPSSIKTGGKIWSQTSEFFANCPAPIIGVTGTKGKGTTSSLIAAILRASGFRVHLVGNIGLPALDVLPEVSAQDVIVYELSSFQLWDLAKSPRLAVVLMIEPDHLDVHSDMEEYIDAKSNIARHQSGDDIVLYHPTNQYSKQIADTSRARRARYAVVDDGQVYVRENTFFIRDVPICHVDALQLPGVHNIENACAAISAALAMGADPKRVEAGLRDFDGLPHRLKFVGQKDDVRYFDDSIATTPGSAMAALRAFIEPVVLILGGSDKGADYREIISLCKERDAKVVAIGQTGETIAALCRELEVSYVRESGGMSAVVATARALAAAGDVVVLSPASASFDQYEGYADRGEQFIAAVKRI